MSDYIPGVSLATFLYKGFTGLVQSIRVVGTDPPQTYTYRGCVALPRDVVTFVGEGTAETITANTGKAFRESMDAYLEWVKELGEEPEKPR